jgi:hypothetical protein
VRMRLGPRTGHVIAMNMRTAVRVLKIQGHCNYDTLLRAYKKLKRHRGSTERAQQIEAAMDYLQCNLPARALHTPSAELLQHKEIVKEWKLAAATEEQRKEFEDWLDSTFDYYEVHKSRYEIFEFLSVYAEYHAKVERELRNSRRKNRRKPGTRAHRRTRHREGGLKTMIKRFVREHLVLSEGKFLLASCVYKRFAEVHGHMSEAEHNLLRRNCKDILLAEMPGAAYGRLRFERGFRNVALK